MKWYHKFFGITPKSEAFNSYIEEEKAKQLQEAVEAKMRLTLSIESQQAHLDGCNKTIERLTSEIPPAILRPVSRYEIE